MALHGGTGAQIVETFVSEWDASAKQYRAVVVGGTDDYVKVASNANVRCIGILQNKPTSGEAARVCLAGYCKAVAGDTVTRGNAVLTTSLGYLYTINSGFAVGVAVESVASGSVFGMIVAPHYFQ